MSPYPYLYLGEFGVPIRLECGIDITAATALSINVRKPDGATAVWPALAQGTTAIQYFVQAGDLAVVGLWRLQARVVGPGGSDRLGSTAMLSVRPRWG